MCLVMSSSPLLDCCQENRHLLSPWPPRTHLGLGPLSSGSRAVPLVASRVSGSGGQGRPPFLHSSLWTRTRISRSQRGCTLGGAGCALPDAIPWH